MAYDGEIRINTNIDTNKASSQLLSLENRIVKTADKIADMKRRMEELENTRIPTEQYKDLQDNIDEATAELERLNGVMEEMRANGTDSGDRWDSISESANDYREIIEMCSQAQQRMIREGRAFTLGSQTAEYQKLSRALKSAQGDMDVLKKKWDEQTKRVSKAGKAIDSFGKKVGGLVKKIFVFGLITKAFQAMIRGMKEGLENFAQYSQEYNATISGFKSATETLKNSMATLAAPILNAVIPAITTFINYINSAISKVAELFAALTGKGTFTKAIAQQVDYAKSLKGTEKAAKKAEGALQGFDELNVINVNDQEDAGGGTGATAAFEEVPVDIPEKWKQLLEKIKAKLKELAESFKNGFYDALGDIGPRMATIKNGLDQIRTALVDIFTDPQVQTAADNWANSFFYMLGSVAGAVASIGLTIAANLIGGLGSYLESNTDRIKQYIVNMFSIGTEINTLVAEFSQAIAYIFEAFASENGVAVTANIIGIFADAFMYVTEIAAKFGADILGLIVQPFIDNQEMIRQVVEDALGVIGQILGVVKDLVDYVGEGLMSLYDEHIHPFIEDVQQGISEIFGALLDVYEQYFIPVFDGIAAKLTPFVDTYVKPMIDAILELVGEVIDILKLFWDNVLQPLIMWIVQNILPKLAPIIDGIADRVGGVIGVVTSLIEGITKTITTFLRFIKEGFTTGDWKKAWDSAKKTFCDIWDGIVQKLKSAVNMILGGVEKMANGVVWGINRIIDTLNNLSFDIPGWVPFIGGDHVGFNIPKMSDIKLPRLAEGGVLPGGNPFLAMLGDQPAGQTNIEAPLETITDAMRNANGDQIPLLREQNEILRMLLAKEWKISPDEVFNSVRRSDRAYVNMHGVSAFGT